MATSELFTVLMNNTDGLLHYSIGEGIEAFSTMRNAQLPYPVTQPHQTHQDNIALVDKPGLTREDLEGIDALITNIPGCAIGVRTADCIPVLLYDPVNRAVAAIHCGWKGTVLHISQKVIKHMSVEFGTSAENIISVIGPGIGPNNFQVKGDVVEKFREAQFPMHEICFDDGPRQDLSMKGGLHINLWKANRWLLERTGVKSDNIIESGVCTYKNNDLFFSARREGTKCGRIINAIKII